MNVMLLNSLNKVTLMNTFLYKIMFRYRNIGLIHSPLYTYLITNERVKDKILKKKKVQEFLKQIGK